ncbi:MAG: MBL fold metallo-hydrolase [Candidatus Sumerlaeaceae bacterium]|nr:MBL fold metallo-hydrolase [Candidatus Sumerlaeaceae bacterium]
MKIKFWGAAHTVTGSSHLLLVDGARVLLDCGLFQGSRKIARQINSEFVIPPAGINEMILSHAHIDHSGNIPGLVKAGFRGPIYCTPATQDLTRVLLRDSGHIQESDANFLNRKKSRNHEPPVEPLYTMDDAERAIPLLRPRSYDEPFTVANGRLSAVFRDVGHILGSAFVEMTAAENGQTRKIIFSGDIGPPHKTILKDPEVPAEADVLIMESTYGNRCHAAEEDVEIKLADCVNRVVARGGKIIIPAFSVERTQEVVYALNKLWNAGKLQRIPVYVDSPLAVNVTEIFRHHPECFDQEINQSLIDDPDPFGFEGLIYVRDVMTSKRINMLRSPCIVISGSGMCEAGRVLHHLANNIEDPRSAVFFVGFQAENTLGRKLVDGLKEVKILGDPYQVKAEIVIFNSFSGHADAEGLRAFAGNVAQSGRLKKIFLVHGEETAMAALKETLGADLPNCEVIMPARGEEFEI